jgi:hypothetical protein
MSRSPYALMGMAFGIAVLGFMVAMAVVPGSPSLRSGSASQWEDIKALGRLMLQDLRDVLR